MKKIIEVALKRAKTIVEGKVAEERDEVYVGINRLTGKNPRAWNTQMPVNRNVSGVLRWWISLGNQACRGMSMVGL